MSENDAVREGLVAALRPFMRLGSKVGIGGATWTVAAVGNGGMVGERYYWLVDPHGGVAMFPANVVEAE